MQSPAARTTRTWPNDRPSTAATDAVTRGEDDEDVVERPTVNGTIELKRLSRQPTLGRVPDDDEDDDDRVADGTAAADNDSRSSDFSADIILHDTVVHASTSGFPVSVHSQRTEAAAAGDSDSPQRLVLDSATCAGSFILANDEPTGRTYSLLVPITSPAVQPLLAAGDAQPGGPRLLRISSGAGGCSSKVGAGQSIVRLKLRKHATVDYSSVEEDSGQTPRGSTAGATEARSSGTIEPPTEPTANLGHRVSVCCGRQGNIRLVEQQRTGVVSATSSNHRMTRSFSSDW